MLYACRQVHYFAVTTETFNGVHRQVSDKQHNKTQAGAWRADQYSAAQHLCITYTKD